mmetsp:Transcript_5317/g.13096  ORF Transcript_5317/g.13096 Transcript_5317/m.13096 type:complete len:267 (-) Transcript_5317:876-1676(-)
MYVHHHSQPKRLSPPQHPPPSQTAAAAAAPVAVVLYVLPSGTSSVLLARQPAQRQEREQAGGQAQAHEGELRVAAVRAAGRKAEPLLHAEEGDGFLGGDTILTVVVQQRVNAADAHTLGHHEDDVSQVVLVVLKLVHAHNLHGPPVVRDAQKVLQKCAARRGDGGRQALHERAQDERDEHARHQHGAGRHDGRHQVRHAAGPPGHLQRHHVVLRPVHARQGEVVVGAEVDGGRGDDPREVNDVGGQEDGGHAHARGGLAPQQQLVL